MNIVTLNIWDLPLWFVKDRQNRVRRSAEYFRAIGADIICLQESFDARNREIFQDVVSKEYQATDMEYKSRRVFFRRFDKTGGLVMFSKFPIRESRFIRFNRFLNSSFVEYFGRKGMLISVLETPHGLLRVVNTHLHKPSWFFDRVIRLQQLRAICTQLRKEKPLPTILAGDLNEDGLFSDRRFVGWLTKEQFSSVSHAVPQPSYRAENPYIKNVWMNRISKSKRYDYILYCNLQSESLQALDCKVLELPEPLSDHDPVVLSLGTQI